MTKDDILDVLATIQDPELGINIVDLGLIYELKVEKDIILIKMTLTTATCPFSEELEARIIESVNLLGYDVEIVWVFMPPWNVSKVSDEGMEMLKALGFTVR